MFDLQASLRQVNKPSITFRANAPLKVAESFHLTNEVVGRLPGHAELPRKIRRPHAIRNRVGEDREVRLL